MIYQGISFAIVVGFALGSALYYYLKNQQPHQNIYNQYYVNKRKITYRPSRIETPSSQTSRKGDQKGQECLICLKSLTQNKTTLKCGHTFHDNCIRRWFRDSKCNRCPICSKSNDEECVICCELLINNSKRIHCGHTFHDHCIRKWFKTSKSTRCPLCCKSNEEECLICYEPVINNLNCLHCGHIFHNYCIKKWFKESKTCPLGCSE